MKLFGNHRSGQHVQSRSETRAIKKSAAAEGGGAKKSGKTSRWRSIPLILRILMIVILILLLLALGLFIWYKMVVKPPDTSLTTEKTASPGTTITTKIDEETGEEVEVEVYSDGEEAFQAPTTKTVVEVDEETGEEIEYDIPVSKKEGFYNILIAGTDGDGGRTDTIMIASLDTTTHEVAIMSVPRDTYISASYSVPKINSAYGAGGMGEDGMASLKNQLAKLLGFEVDGYVLVDLDAFVEIVDLIGGVEFNVPMDMYYSDPSQDLYINLSAGLQVLDGEHAIQLVRYRSGYASADLQRTTVQQDFLRALAKQCLQFSNIDKITEMAEIVSTYVQTDLTTGNMIYFATELLKCDFDEMVTVTLPGEGITINGGSYYALYTNQVLEIINEYFNPYDTEITASDVNIPGSRSSSGSVSYNTGSSNHGSYSTSSGSSSSSSSGSSGYSGTSSGSSSGSGSQGSNVTTSQEPEESTTPSGDILPDDELPSDSETPETSDTAEPDTSGEPAQSSEPTQSQVPSGSSEPTQSAQPSGGNEGGSSSGESGGASTAPSGGESTAEPSASSSPTPSESSGGSNGSSENTGSTGDTGNTGSSGGTGETVTTPAASETTGTTESAIPSDAGSDTLPSE